jgi:pectate lyase
MNSFRPKTTLALALLICTGTASWGKARDLLGKPDSWFNSAEGRSTTENVLSWQTAAGSWPKNIDTTARAYSAQEKPQGTFDNGATTGELRYLARAYQATKDDRCREACLRGIDHVLEAQYLTGGWPQYYPPSAQYHRHITFNDDAMVRIMDLVRDVAKSPAFEFIDAARRETAMASFGRGIECILKCQIRINGKLTGWCAQHDEENYQPRKGRSYELPSISGAESAGILELLMSLEEPSPDVIRAVHAGAKWFASAKVTGLRIVRSNGDKRAIQDPKAPPLWARFYDLENGRPFFSDRDGVKKYEFDQLGAERRNGYAWYGDWGSRVERLYAKWCEQHPRPPERN